MIVSEIDRLNRTVSQLLAFSRPSHADSRPVALSDLINSTLALLDTEAKERGVEVSATSGPDVTLTGEQAAALREALSNLILNAVQATESGGEVAVRADVECDKPVSKPAASRQLSSPVAAPPSRLILSITDTGPGIPEEEQGRIFEPFYTTKSRGTGLGLAIVQRRVGELGGLLELTSPARDGHGTEFRLIVPLEPVLEERAKNAS